MEENACLICFFKRTFALWVFAWVWQLFNWLFLLTRILSTKCGGSWGKFKYQFYVLIKAAIPQAAINPAANFIVAPGFVLMEICPCPLLVAGLAQTLWGICEGQRSGMGRGDRAGSVPRDGGDRKGAPGAKCWGGAAAPPSPAAFFIFECFFSFLCCFSPSFLCLCFLSFHLCVFFIFWWKFKNLVARDREIEVLQKSCKQSPRESWKFSWRPQGSLGCPTVSHLWRRSLCWVSQVDLWVTTEHFWPWSELRGTSGQSPLAVHLLLVSCRNQAPHICIQALKEPPQSFWTISYYSLFGVLSSFYLYFLIPTCVGAMDLGY